MASPLHDTPRIHINRSLIKIIIVFVLSGCGLIVLTNMAINMLSASRSYTAVQAHWSRSQQMAFNQLDRYRETGNVRYYQKYRNTMTTVNDIRVALHELHSENPNPKKIYIGFKNTYLQPADITGMITAFRQLEFIAGLVQYDEKWQILNRMTLKLDSLGRELKKAMQKKGPDHAAVNGIWSELRSLSNDLLTQKQSLLVDLGILTRNIRQGAIWLIVLVGIILVITGVLVSVRLSKSVRKWQQILKERNYLASFPENNPTPIVHTDLKGNVKYTNPTARQLFPAVSDQQLDHPFMGEVRKILDKEDWKKQVFTREVGVGDEVYQQTVFHVEAVDALYIYAVDITRQKEQEKRLRNSLEEKELLLGEIHHRVKNNLAIISGLLEMQKMSMDDPDLKDALRDSQSRIQSMATIHDILYNSEQFTDIDMQKYIRELEQYLIKAYTRENQRVEFESNVEQVKLNINQAIPCGLILSELTANAIQHGFSDGQSGKLCITLREYGDKVTASVEDDGRGLPDSFNMEKDNSMGMTIINTLIQQLEAELKVHSNSGTCFEFNFTKSDAAGSSSNLF